MFIMRHAKAQGAAQTPGKGEQHHQKPCHRTLHTGEHRVDDGSDQLFIA